MICPPYFFACGNRTPRCTTHTEFGVQCRTETGAGPECKPSPEVGLECAPRPEVGLECSPRPEIGLKYGPEPEESTTMPDGEFYPYRLPQWTYNEEGKPVERIMKPLICIDPGHGGADPGATSMALVESKLNLSAAYVLLRRLRDSGYPVILTRRSDEYLDIESRLNIARDAEAGILISLHHNASESVWARGVEVFYAWDDTIFHRLFGDGSAADECLAGNIGNFLAEECRFRETSWRGVRRDTKSCVGKLGILRGARMPACLVELGFISNEGDRELIVDPGWHAHAAMAIQSGIDEFLKGL